MLCALSASAGGAVTGPPDRILEVWDPEWIPSRMIWDDRVSSPDSITTGTNLLLISVRRYHLMRWYLQLLSPF